MTDLSEMIERALSMVGNGRRQDQRKEQRQKRSQDDEAVNREKTHSRADSGSWRSSVGVGSSAFDLKELIGHADPSPQDVSDPDAAMITASVVKASPASSATIRPRLNMMARWQICAISSKSVDTTSTARPSSRARAISP